VTWCGPAVTTGNSLIRVTQVNTGSALTVAHSMGDVANSGSLRVSSDVGRGDTLRIGALTGSGSTTVAANSALSATVIRQSSLTVEAGAIAILRGGSKTTSVLNALDIAGSANAWTGTVDVMHNALVVQSATGVDANAAYAKLVNQARFACDNLNWDRAGLTSSTAQADTRKVTGVAVVLNRDDSTEGSPSFLSVFDATPDANLAVAVDTMSVLVKYTYYGDADLNGIVDERDLDRFSTGYSDQRSATPKGLNGWAWGDWDNNGTIDERDLDLFSTAYSLHGSPLSPGAVPEPGTLVLIGLGFAALVRGRRRRKA